MRLREIQKEQSVWAVHNFGPRESIHALLGIQEEVGELSHVHLKFLQKIRNYSQTVFEDKARDAIGDIVIYLMDYCNAQGWDLEEIVTATWTTVKIRDWKKFPNNGRTE
jgi:NTP pyrophosphatase (non-canonical NTP hydrolase)